MKIQVTTNPYQAQRSSLFSGRNTSTILKKNITIKEGKNYLQDWALQSGCNNILLENGDIYDTNNEYIIYSYGEKSFSDDGFFYSLLPNNY
tara:strand:+ start:3072 stop:3344 length:273 start_codon:yes stop_codon:yes gene_type:complete